MRTNTSTARQSDHDLLIEYRARRRFRAHLAQEVRARAERWDPLHVPPGRSREQRCIALVGRAARHAGTDWRPESWLERELVHDYGIDPQTARLSVLAFGAALGAIESRLCRGRQQYRSAPAATVAKTLRKARAAIARNTRATEGRATR